MSRSATKPKPPHQHRTDLAEAWALLERLRLSYQNQLEAGSFKQETMEKFERAKRHIEEAVAYIEASAGLPPRKAGKQDTLFDNAPTSAGSSGGISGR